MIFKLWIFIENHNLEMLRKILQTIYRPNPYPKGCQLRIIESWVAVAWAWVLRIDLKNILFGHYVILFHGNSMVFEKISKHSLKVNDDDRSIHLIHSTPKVMPICPLVKFTGRWHHMHFQVVLLHLLNLIVLCRLLLLRVSHRNRSLLLNIFSKLSRSLEISDTI